VVIQLNVSNSSINGIKKITIKNETNDIEIIIRKFMYLLPYEQYFTGLNVKF
jgi:hypothetical protein